MKHLFLALSTAVFFAASASATVTYSTSGLFNCTNGSFSDAVNSNTDTISGCAPGGSGSISLTNQAGTETITLLFNNIPSQSLNASTGTAAFYGSILATCSGVGCGANATLISLPGGVLSLALLISETAPDVSPNNSAGIASLTGGIANDASNLTIGSFSGSPVTVHGATDTVIYTINSSDTIFAPSNGTIGALGLTGLGMRITDENVTNSDAPEPQSLALMGAGLVLLGFARRRNRI